MVYNNGKALLGLALLALAFVRNLNNVLVLQDCGATAKEQPPEPVVVVVETGALPELYKTEEFPPPNTEIFWPSEDVSRARFNDAGDKYRGYKMGVISICCSANEDSNTGRYPTGSQSLNAEYFPAHGIPYMVFHHCVEGGFDHERIWRVQQTLEHTNWDFAVWMDCDAGVIVGPKAKAGNTRAIAGEELLDPFDRFLWAFDLFHPDPSKRELVAMVLTRHADHDGGEGSVRLGYCDNEFVYCPLVPNTDCHINSGVFVVRKRTAGPVLHRFRQMMRWDNVTSENACVDSIIPDWSQNTFNWILQEQISLTTHRDHPIRAVFAGNFNRRYPPKQEEQKRFHRLSSKQKQLLDIPPSFVFHTYGVEAKREFWDCAYGVEPRSAENILDKCYHFLNP